MERKKILKIWDFSKGVRSMVFVKNLKFFHLFIFGKIRQENLFDDILEGKKHFLTLKSKSLKRRRIGIFPKELVHGLVKNLKFLSVFIFGKISQQNVFDVILESEKAFLYYKKQKVKEVKKWVSLWFW